MNSIKSVVAITNKHGGSHALSGLVTTDFTQKNIATPFATKPVAA